MSVALWPGRKTVYDGGRWTACVYCDPLVEARDVSLLLARVLSLKPEWSECGPGFARLWSAVFDCTERPPVLWSAGDAFPIPRDGSSWRGMAVKWTEAEAQAEANRNFPGMRPEGRAMVCDVCFRQIMRRANG